MRNFYTLLLGGLLFCLANSLSGQNISIGLTDVDGEVGETVCIDIVGANFDRITALQFSITFDTMNVRYVSGSASINGTNVSIGFRDDRPHQLRLNYAPFSSTGYTDAGPFVIGQLCFMVVREIETEIMIVDSPLPVEFTNEDLETFGFNDVDIDNGFINGGGGGMPTCSDGIMNGNETGVDCGGPDCPACPTCNDGIQNGDETGIDCGGSCTPCVTTPTCSDGIMNGDETGVDCGGSCTPCVTPPTCSDGIMNGDETGIDCGGSNCAPCTTGCGEGSSSFTLCVGEVCDIAVGAQACVELRVTNFTDINGMQMDINYPAANLNYASFTPNPALGGGLQVTSPSDGLTRLLFFRSADSPVTLGANEVFATLCFTNETLSTTTLDAGQLQLSNTSGVINDFVINDGSVNSCVTPTCNDGIQNGNETGVDCGGPDCAACPTPTCNDGIQNGDETGVDCGGSCAPCVAATCGEGSSVFNMCVSDVCDIAVGAQACVDLTVANFINVTAVQMNVLYPSANLEFAGFTPNPALADALQINEFADGEVRIIFFRSADSPETLTDGDVFATLCFTNEVAGSTLVNADGLRVTDTGGMVTGPVANDGTINDCTVPTCSDGIRNGNETGVDCGGPDCAPCAAPTCNDGMMNGGETGVDCGGPDCVPCATNATCGEGSDVFNLCVGQACDIAAGAQFCVDLTVANFTGITGLQMDLKYPAANLNYQSFTANAALGDALQINEFTDGDLRFVLFLGADMPVTLANDAVFATLCFTNETAGVTMLNADRLRATGADGNPLVGPIANDGMVNGCMVTPTCNDGIMNGNETGVDCGGPDCAPCDMGGCGEGTTDPEICIGSVCGDAGAEVCVPVFVGNFDNLFGFQFSLSYLPANLEYTRFTAAAALQSGVTVGSPSDGTVNLIWNDPNLAGVTFPADEMAFEICFTVQTVAATPITFRDEANTLRFFDASGDRIPGSGNPGSVNQNCGNTPTCTDGIMNGNETGIDCGGPDCAPCMTTCGEGSDVLNVCVGEACNVAVGGQACVDLTVSMFTDITGMQMSIFYPAANLNYASFTPNPAASGGLQVNGATDGEVRLIFFRSADNPISLDDGDVLMTLCFTTETAATTILDATGLQIANTSGSIAGALANDGRVNGCSAGPTCNDGIQNGGETGIDCGGPNCIPCTTCTDGIMNGDETGVDCGGPDCEPCITCDDGIMNGDETGVDCGGPDCEPCTTCNDGIMNGDETGIDCGGSCPNTCPTTGTLGLNISDGTAQVGQQVCVPVRVTDFTNVADISLTVNFDNTVLSLASVTANSALPGLGAGNFTTTASTITVNYTPASPQTLANGEIFFTICFNVQAGDETQVTITNATATNGGGSGLTVNTDPGTINTGGIEPYENLTMVVSQESGALGTEVCLDVSVFNMTNLAGLQFTINYDETKLEYVSGTGTGQLPNLQANNQNPGIINVVWFDPNLNGNDVPDGESILSICFNVLEACRTPVTISNPRAADPSNTSITPVDLIAGGVNNDITCGGGGTPDNLILDLGSRDGALGSEVCVDLKVTDFTSLTDLSFSIAYDATKVTFTQATNFRLPSITAANFTTPAAGQIRFDWDAPGPAGRTIPDGATMVSLCFTVDRFAVAPLDFSNSPIAIMARNASNQSVGVVPSGGSINPNAPVADDLTFQIGSTQAEVDDEICLPIIAFKAIDLVSFQYTINYDPAELEYLRMEPNNNISAFRNISVNRSMAGTLRVLWFDPALNPNTVEDGTALYNICFRVLSTDPTLVTFGDEPTAIEFENTAGNIEAELINGCVNCTPAPVIVSSNINDPDCRDGSDGSIALTVSGGTGLTYQWSSNVSTSATATNLSPGNYCVTVTNPATSQSTSDCFEVANPGPFDITVDMVSGVSCFGETDGRITIATVGDTGPYIFDWSGNLQDGTPTQTMLPGGSFGVTVTDDNGCVRSLNNITVGEPDVVNIRGQLTNITDAPGRIDATVTGGRTPYQYSWSGPNDFMSDQEDIEPAEAGTYCLTVIDNRNCSDIQCFAIIRALAILDTDVDSGCPGENNGSIDLTVTGGEGNYNYLWSDGNMDISMNQDIDNLAPGDYTVTVTSGANQVVQTITVEEPTGIVIMGEVTNATSGSNGAIVVVPSGGNSPYTYEWADGPTTQNRSNLDAGEYCVTVTDASMCEMMRCFTVGAAAPSITGLVALPASCADAEDGIIRLTMTNGVAPIVVSIPELPFMYTDEDNNIEASVPPGTYTVNLTDDQGAMLSTMVTVEGPDPLTFTSTVTSDTEDMDCSGMITLSIAGGTSPYTVAWSNNDDGITISQLCAGSYTGTITDANGCTLETDPIEVSRIDEEVASITDVACADGTEGAIDVTITGGMMPYSFSWARTGTPDDEISTEEDLSSADVAGGVTAGGYTLTVVDASGAMLIRNYTVGISAGFSVTTTVTSDFNGFGVSCPGATDGRIVIEISGQGNFMYEFILNGEMVGIDSVLENAAAGIYTVTVLDEGNCELSEMIEVTAPPELALSASITQISCGNVNDGSIGVSATGGVGTYSYLWSNDATTPRISGLGAGTYGVTVTDENNCTTGESFTLTAPEDLAITFEAVDATEGCNGSVQIIPLGGSGNYRYTWPQLPSQGNNALAEGLCPGEYTIEVTDDNECQTVTMIATVLDRRFPCLSAREVITPNGDGLNEKFILFCSNDDAAINNTMQVFNRYGQLVYKVADYDCSSDDSGTNCFEGKTNDGSVLPEGPYYYIFDFTNLQGEPKQQRGSLTIVRE